MNAPIPISDSGANPSVWPRRALRACASCRRDKIRCDRARPCNACVRRGYTGDQCTNGCEPCRRARVRCEEGNGRPCKRCRDMNIDCEDGLLLSGTPQRAPNLVFVQQRPQIQGGGVHHRSSTLGSTGNPGKRSDEFKEDAEAFSTPSNETFVSVALADQTVVAGSAQGKLARGAERAKLACVACRRDNKKCDDHRPCSRCVARSEDCIHVARGPKLVKLRCEGCREDNKKCEESRPCRYCLDTDKECVNVPRKGRGQGARVKSACVSCRRDKIRCNGDRPCNSCVKKRCECIERACPNCTTEGKGSECTHRRSPERMSSGSPASDASSPSNPKTSSSAAVKEKDYYFVPSQDDARWISFSTSSGARPPSAQPPNSMYSEQQQQSHSAVPPTDEYYYYPDSGMRHQTPQLQTPSMTIMHNHLFGHSSSNPTVYFFDALDSTLSNNYLLAQHMESTSHSRTYLSGN